MNSYDLSIDLVSWIFVLIGFGLVFYAIVKK